MKLLTNSIELSIFAITTHQEVSLDSTNER